MKRFIGALIIAGFMIACNSNDKSSTVEPVVATPDTSSVLSSDLNDGMMQLKDGRVVMLSAGNWEPLQDTVTCTNGRRVAPNGEVSDGDKKKMLTEGMMIDREGQLIDKSGNQIGWE